MNASSRFFDLLELAADRLYSIRRVILVLGHAALIVLANQGAFWLRFDGPVPDSQRPFDTSLLPLVVVVRLMVFIPMRLHEGVWRYASIWDLRRIAIGVGSSSLVLYGVIHGVLGLGVYPRSVFIIDALLLLLMMGGVRMARRVVAVRSPNGGRRVLIYGAGDAGELVVRDMHQNATYLAEPIGFVDDNLRKVGSRIHGVKVLGTREDLPRILEQQRPDEVLITIPSATPETLRKIVRAIEPFKVRITTLPRLSELVGQRVEVGQIRQLKVEDLLARDPVALDATVVREALGSKRVLVTGGGGSIGSELCRQIAALRPAELVMLDRYENTLYMAHQEVTAANPAARVHAVIADVTDETTLDRVFATHRPQVVFHAAAHKHVPLMEKHPSEAVKNNVRGTRLVAQASSRHGAERFVLISTDKAVEPTSVMGAAKRVAELIVTSMNGSSATQFVTVRFGNVLASNGSVVPLFQSQIARGGPVTVTHPEMRRYFMLIPEAVQLVLQAAAIGDDGSILVLDMGEQVKVADLARDVIRLSGYIPDVEIKIFYSGARPGEKLQEDLVGPDEEAEPASVPKLMKVRSRTPPPGSLFSGALDALERAALDGRDDFVVTHLCRIVPAFRPQSLTFLPSMSPVKRSAGQR
jgi:FlaA1/EpsC-like NDP-sugar epimerase